MKRLSDFAINTWGLLAALLMGCGLSAFIVPALGQDFKRPDGSIPLPMDWSDQHVIYTVGFPPDQVEKMQGDPRFFVAMRLHGKALADENAANGYPILRRDILPRESPANDAWESPPEPPWAIPLKPRRTNSFGLNELKKDWSVSLGPTAGVAAGQYPAKFTYDVNATPSCANDYAVFPVNASTGSTRANVVGTFTTAGDPGGHSVNLTVTPTVGSAVMLTLTSSTTVNSGLNFEVSAAGGTGTAASAALNLAAAINRNLSGTNAAAIVAVVSSTGTAVTVYTLTPGSRVTLGVTETLNNLSFGTVTAGTNGTQANIVGFNNLYSGTTTPFCTGDSFPTFIFSYASGTGAVTTSPVVSLDGKKIVYVENSANIGTVLHVLTFGSGSTEYGSCTNSGTAAPTCAIHPVIPGSTAGSTGTDFMVPLSVVGLGTATSTDTRSAPFVNYGDDVLYVGEDQGHLYAVTPVFLGTPALVPSPFPVTVPTTGILSSPVVDVAGTGDVFIGDSLSNVFDYNPIGTRLGTQSIGNSTNGGIHDGAIVDSTNEKVYFTTNCNGTGATPTNQIAQFPVSASGFGTPNLATLDASGSGCASSPNGLPQYAVVPDNQYYTKGISSATIGNNGHLIVCWQGIISIHLDQWQFVSGNLQATSQYDNNNFVTSGSFTCSPITEFYGKDVAYTPSALTQTGTTVTVTTATNLFVTGQVVTVAGVAAGTGNCTTAAAAAINGEHTVTVTNATTFTFTSAVSATITSGNCTLTGSSATGPTQDYVFFGTTQPSAWTFTLPMTSATQTQAATNTGSVTGGTSGMIVDNDSSSGQASSIYFGTQATSTTQCGSTAAYCAVKLTQSGLL